MSLQPRRLGPLALAGLFTAVSLVTALDYALLPGASTLETRRAIHEGILGGIGTPPDRFRFLVPSVIDVPISVIGQAMPKTDAIDRAYAVYYVVAMTTLLWSLFAYVRVWFTDAQALAGVLFVASTLPITARQHDYAPYSFLEPTFVAWALLLILKGQRVVLAFVIALATLNRETAIFLVLIYALSKPASVRHAVTTLILAGVWAMVFFYVRFILGDALRYWTIGKVWASNMSQPLVSLFNITALFGIFWVFAIVGARRAPTFVRRTAIVIPIYLATIAVWSIWWEVRLLLPMMPLLLPLALSALFEPSAAPRLSDPARVDR